jgi:hypothetical protein
VITKRRRFLGQVAAIAGGQMLVALGGLGADEAIAASNVAAPSADGVVIPTVG